MGPPGGGPPPGGFINTIAVAGLSAHTGPPLLGSAVGPGLNNSPLEFNMNKNNPSIADNRSGDDEYRNEPRRDRIRRNDRRNRDERHSSHDRDRRDNRQGSHDRERSRDKDVRIGDEGSPNSNMSTNNSDPGVPPTNPTSVPPNMWDGLMGMGYPMMGMMLDPANMIGYGGPAMMPPIIQPDGTILPPDHTLNPAHMISLDTAFKSYRRVNMEFTNAEVRAILKFSFVKGESARETFREINSVLGDGTLSLRTAEEWFRRFRAEKPPTPPSEPEPVVEPVPPPPPPSTVDSTAKKGKGKGKGKKK